MLVTYVERCTHCTCSSLRDESGNRPMPGVVGCGRACSCHAPQINARAVSASLAHDAARFRFWRRTRAAAEAVAAVR